tara:strand:+ start:496 stop:633 length:138 start_codon:yes stop_codon:yes gene_type:complete
MSRKSMNTSNDNAQEILHEVPSIKWNDWNQIGQPQTEVPPDEPKQ